MLSSLCLTVGAQTKMRDVFLQMPDSILPYLTQNSRLDFIDFMDSGMKAVVNNELGGRSEMLSLTDDAVVLKVSPAMQVSMRLMPVAEVVDSCSQVVCMVKTFGEDTLESHIDIYSVRWNRVEVSAHLDLPQEPYVADFMEDPSKGLSLRQVLVLDPIANEEQKKELPWLKNIEWKP